MYSATSWANACVVSLQKGKVDMSDELKALARAYADGEITESQLKRLESILQSDAESRQQYLQELNFINVLEDLSMSAESQLPGEVRDTHRVGIPYKTVIRGACVAAALLLVAFLVINNGGITQSAMAAVQRSIDVTAEKTTRKYRMQIERREQGTTIRTSADLYVRGNDCFALRHPSPLPGESVWMGRHDGESWIVTAMGPVLKGDHTLHRRVTRDELDVPSLDLSTLLTRMMSSGYQLETLSDEEIAGPDGRVFECQHIRAERKTADQPDLPAAIELWASRESGIAVKLIVRWALADGDTGKELVVMSFQGDEPELSDAWFTAEGHVAQEQSDGPPQDDVDR